MSARVVAVTQLLLDVLVYLGTEAKTGVTPAERDLQRTVQPISAELRKINERARAEMMAEVVKVLET